MIALPPAPSSHPPARDDDLVIVQILAPGSPPTTGLQRHVAGIGTMPDMAVVAGQDHHPTRISGQLQERAQRADAVDRPVVTDLLGTAQSRSSMALMTTPTTRLFGDRIALLRSSPTPLEPLR